MTLILKKISDPYSFEVHSVIKTGLFPFVDQVFGWDDAFQEQRIKDEYQLDWFHWVCGNDVKKGLLCFKPYEHSIHVHLLIVFPEYQAQGMGKNIMDFVKVIAGEEKRDVTLSSFKCNSKAVALYKKLGYIVTKEEDDFLSFRLPFGEKLTENAEY